MQQSVWRDRGKVPKWPCLRGDVNVSALIIGGGMCGILCAHFLELAGVDYLLAEGKTIGSGITANTTAKITSQHGLIYSRLIQSLGREKATQYLQANEKALKKYRELAEKIDCGFEEKKAFVYLRSDRQLLEEETHAANTLGLPATFTEKTSLPFPTAGAVCFPNQAQFHPLKFLYKIAEPLNIYEHTYIRKIINHTAWTDYGKIHADYILITTHFPFLNRHGSYFLKLYQHRSYVLALENAADVGGMYIDGANIGLSFRNYKNLLLIGGAGHRTGRKGGGWESLRSDAASLYPNAQEKYHWAAQDCMSLDGIPYIGNYSANTPNLFAASGFNKWGMTSSMAAALLLCDMVLGKDCTWGSVFSPSRNMLKPQLFLNLAESTSNLMTLQRRRCPHMGCALKWNKNEHTWDCPCHGSRFEENGALIDNPAQKNATVLKRQNVPPS